jgi:hypothetical protein
MATRFHLDVTSASPAAGTSGSVRKTAGYNLANYGELWFSRSSLASGLGDRCIFSIFSNISLPSPSESLPLHVRYHLPGHHATYAVETHFSIT